MVNLLIDLVSDLIFLSVLFFVMLIIIRSILYYKILINEKKIKQKKSRDITQIIKKVEDFIKNSWRNFIIFFRELLCVVISAIMGIGSKSIIYKINTPLGEDYAIFASYACAIYIYLLIRNSVTIGEKQNE